MTKTVIGALIVGALLFIWLLMLIMGEGALKRHITMSGVYAICKPEGYDVVCFLDADGKEGGLSCVPLAQAGGKCQ
jgi:hypothetical protein